MSLYSSPVVAVGFLTVIIYKVNAVAGLVAFAGVFVVAAVVVCREGHMHAVADFIPVIAGIGRDIYDA